MAEKIIDHGEYTDAFNYEGARFIVDYFEDNDYWLCTESRFLVKNSGHTFEEARDKVKESWDKCKRKY